MRGREGLASSQVSATVCERKSIQRRSAAESVSAARRDVDVMEMVVSSSLQGINWGESIIESNTYVDQDVTVTVSLLEEKRVG